MSRFDLETVGEETPAEDGRYAYVNGAGRDTCPWFPETDEALEWLRGWDEACKEDHPDD